MDNKRRKEKERGGKHLPFNPAKIAGSGFRDSRRRKKKRKEETEKHKDTQQSH